MLWRQGMQPCLCAVCWPSVEHIQPEQCEKNAAILFVSIEPMHCGGVNRGEVSITLSHPAKKKKVEPASTLKAKAGQSPSWSKKNNGFDLIAQCECHMTPSTCKPAHYRPQYHYCTQEDYSRKKNLKASFYSFQTYGHCCKCVLWFVLWTKITQSS